MVSGMKSKQANNVYWFKQVRKAWEGDTVRSTREYNYILADTCTMISYHRLLVKRIGEIGKMISVVLMTKADYFAE